MSISKTRDLRDRFETSYARAQSYLGYRPAIFYRDAITGHYVDQDVEVSWRVYFEGAGTVVPYG